MLLAFYLARKQLPTDTRSDTAHNSALNSSIGLLRIPGWAEQERRAEFDLQFDPEAKQYGFGTLLNDDCSLAYTDYLPLRANLPVVVGREKWEVGIACARFRFAKHLKNDTLAHWGVYVRRISESPNVSRISCFSLNGLTHFKGTATLAEIQDIRDELEGRSPQRPTARGYLVD